jgi:hypothetical protein
MRSSHQYVVTVAAKCRFEVGWLVGGLRLGFGAHQSDKTSRPLGADPQAPSQRVGRDRPLVDSAVISVLLSRTLQQVVRHTRRARLTSVIRAPDRSLFAGISLRRGRLRLAVCRNWLLCWLAGSCVRLARLRCCCTDGLQETGADHSDQPINRIGPTASKAALPNAAATRGSATCSASVTMQGVAALSPAKERFTERLLRQRTTTATPETSVVSPGLFADEGASRVQGDLTAAQSGSSRRGAGIPHQAVMTGPPRRHSPPGARQHR